MAVQLRTHNALQFTSMPNKSNLFIRFLLIIFWGIIAVPVVGQKEISGTPTKKLQVYFFLDPACPISQQYTVEIKRLNTLYQKEDIEMSLIFPFSGQKNFKKSTKEFIITYQLKIPSKIDKNLEITNKLQATVTPEAFLIENETQILYHGAIDDWYYALGKNRKEATAHYLEDAIKAAIQNKPILKTYEKAVGCLIELGK